jgi:uncharacterized membrane protein
VDHTENTPVDVERTTRAHAGQAMKDGHNVPGLVGVAIGVIALVVGLFLMATGQESRGLAAMVVAAVSAAVGIGWLIHTHRGVRRAELDWYEKNSDEPAPPPAS